MRVSVRSFDARRARALQDALARVGVEAMALVGPVSARAQTVEDIALLDAALEARDWADGEAVRLARSPSRPAAIVAASQAADPPGGANAAFDASVQIDDRADLVARALASIQRRAASRGELLRRLKTARALEVAAAPAAPIGPLRALYIGEPSPFFLAQERALSAASGRLEAAFSSFMGFDFLHDARFDAVTLNATNDAATALALCGAMRRNARLHHLPTAVIVRRGDEATVRGAVERGASLIIGADASPEPALQWLFEHMRCARQHARVEAGLADVLRTSAGAGGLFSERFFTSHLARLVETANMRGRSLAIIALRVALAPGARRAEERAWSRNVTEIAQLAGRLIRAHDSAALLNDDVIVIALPDGGLTEARRTAERVSGVVECTAFASGENGAGPITLQHSVIELAAGESGRALLARALDPFMPAGAFA